MCPQDAWFYANENFSSLPYSVWMEIALQPCGFLSAYMGTSLLFPEVDYYYRNLDGSARMLSDASVRGETVTCRRVADLHGIQRHHHHSKIHLRMFLPRAGDVRGAVNFRLLPA